MIVTLIKQNEIYEQILPDKVIGKYWLYDTYENKKRELISIVPIDKSWNISSNTKASVFSKGGIKEQTVKLVPQTLYRLEIVNEKVPSYIYCSEFSANTQMFTKYVAPSNVNMLFVSIV